MTSWSPHTYYTVDPRPVFVTSPSYPHGWLPQDPYHQQHNSPPASNPGRSAKYPSINPVLAEDTTLLHCRFDLKQKPAASILPQTYYSHKATMAFAKPTQRMRLISKAFPWTIDIESPAPITCGDVWEAMHSALQDPLVDSEWGFICRDAKERDAVLATLKKRLGPNPTGDKRMRRIDVLGDATLFRGLEKDDDYAKQLLLPHVKPCAETWVVKLIA